MPNCKDCPNYLSQDDTLAKLNKDLGAATCAIHGYVLGKPGATQAVLDRIGENIAGKCGDFGVKGTTEYVALAPVVRSDPDVAGEPSHSAPPGFGGCRGCANLVPEHIVREELGWPIPLCAATGSLIPQRLMVKAAKECGHATPLADGKLGRERDSTDPWGSFHPLYGDGFSFTGVSVPAEAEIDLDRVIEEPLDHPTDAPVSDSDKEYGILAHRLVGHSPSGEPVHLPIFDPLSFTPEERAMIPQTDDDERPGHYIDHMKDSTGQGLVYKAAVSLGRMDRVLALWGDAGTGKTEFCRHLAWLMQLPFVRVSITRSTEVDDLAGKWLLDKDGDSTVMRWQDGRVSTAWVSRCVMLLDEPNVGPNDVWEFIRPMTDNSKQLVLDQARGERRDRNTWNFTMLAMNPAWDPKNIGANELGDADGNRLTNVFMLLPPPHIERQIIQQACLHEGWTIPTEVLDKIMQTSETIRGMIANGSLSQISWGIRPQLAVASAARWMTLKEAYRLAVVDRLEPQVGQEILNALGDYD